MTEVDWAKKIVSEAKNPTVIECGPYNGHETVQIYDACKGGQYIAIEADPRMFPVLKRSLGERGVTLIHAAVGARDGSGLLYQSHGRGDGSSSLRTPKDHLKHFPDITFTDPIEVPMVCLDSIAERFSLDKVDLIWCDIQGCEKDMIAGAQNVLGVTRYLLAECDRVEMYEGQATPEELLSMLPGWELVAEWPANANFLFRNAGFSA